LGANEAGVGGSEGGYEQQASFSFRSLTDPPPAAKAWHSVVGSPALASVNRLGLTK